MNLTSNDKEIIKKVNKEWINLQEWYEKAEMLLSEGVEEITLPCKVLLRSRDTTRQAHEFYRNNFFKQANP